MPRINMRFPEGKGKALTLSYDDGVEQDIRLLEIMKQYGLKGTFNINSGLYTKEGTVFPSGQIHRRMTEKQIFDNLKNSGQEIAVHTLTHPFLEQLPTAMVVNEIMEDRKNLEEQFDTIIRGMAYPYGTLNDTVVAALQTCGIVYARTVVSTYDFRIPQDWMRLTATCHHIVPELMDLAKKFVENKVFDTPYLFYLWGHSYEFEADNNWNIIEDFGRYVGERDDIWYATNIEIYEYIKAYEQLIFSVNGEHIKNPTNTTIYFKFDDDIIKIHAGETIVVKK